ncbi:MAG: hypothetical protein RL329_1067, partial [Bacteroidota bacterium]
EYERILYECLTHKKQKSVDYLNITAIRAMLYKKVRL